MRQFLGLNDCNAESIAGQAVQFVASLRVPGRSEAGGVRTALEHELVTPRM